MTAIDEPERYAEPCLRLLRSLAVLGGTPGALGLIADGLEPWLVSLAADEQFEHAEFVVALQELIGVVDADIESRVG